MKGVRQGDPVSRLKFFGNDQYDPTNPDTWFNQEVSGYPNRMPGDAGYDGDLTDRDAEADEDEDGPPPLEDIPGNPPQDEVMDLSLGEAGSIVAAQNGSTVLEGEPFIDSLIGSREKGKGRMLSAPSVDENGPGDTNQDDTMVRSCCFSQTTNIRK